MKVGDIVRFKSQPDPAVGIVAVIEGCQSGDHTVGIIWDFIDQLGWQRPGDIEIIYEN